MVLEHGIQFILYGILRGSPSRAAAGARGGLCFRLPASVCTAALFYIIHERRRERESEREELAFYYRMYNLFGVGAYALWLNCDVRCVACGEMRAERTSQQVLSHSSHCAPLPLPTAGTVTLVRHLPLPMAFIAAARPFCVERTRAPALPPAAASGLPTAAVPAPGAAVAAAAAAAACPLSAGGRSSTLELSGPAPSVSPRICSAAKYSLLCSGGSVAPLRRVGKVEGSCYYLLSSLLWLAP